MTQGSLKDKTIRGTVWSAADAFLGQGVTFLVGIVLARLLSPDEYGLIGICVIFNTVLCGIVDSGFSTALIRKKEVSNAEYNTMFVTNMVISVVLYVLLFFSSPFVASFFDREELTSLLRVTSLVLIFNALSITQVTILTKRIDFKTKTKASLISAISSGVIGIAMAFGGFGVWALVGQMVSKSLIYTVCLWIFNKWIPRLEFSRGSFSYMWGFGWKMLVSGLLNNVWNQLYQVVVGKFYSPATLGHYTRAKEYASIFSSNITSIVERVSYPVLAEIQDERTRMIEAYRKIIKITMFVTFVCMFGLGAISESMIYCLIGPQWKQAATFLPLICISMSLYPLHSINLNMLKVLGRSDIFLYLEIIKKIIAIGPICIGIFVGIYWMLLASIVTGIICYFLNSYYTGKKLGYSSWMQIRDVAPSFGIAVAVALSVYFFKYLPISNWLILPLQLAVGTVVFIVLCKATKNAEYSEVKGMLRSLVASRKK